MNHPTTFWLLLLLSLLLSLGVLGTVAQNDVGNATFDNLHALGSPCSSADEESTIQCQQKENRLCYYTEITGKDGDGGPVCGACLEGFVEIPAALTITGNITTTTTTTTTQSQSQICWSIQNLTLELFLDLFQPQWIAPQNSTTAQLRLQILRDMAQFVSEHNRASPPHNYSLALNGYSADLPEETTGLLGYKPPKDGRLAQDFLSERLILDAEVELPKYINWVEQGAVTLVKNQGRCGCCWSLSIAGAIEGVAAITTGYLQSISFQQMISCDKKNGGCNGGFPAAALLYANNNIHGGLAILNDYPYTDGNRGKTTTNCQMQRKLVKVESEQARVATFYGLSPQDDTTYTNRLNIMKQAVSRQPVAIAMKSNCRTLMSYRRGVLTDDGGNGRRGCGCGPGQQCLDHAVLLVGYNDDHSPPYWLIKNSWGTSWGEDGYFRVAQKSIDEENENSWGLFGMLAEGVLPLQAYNLTAQVQDEEQILRKTWQKILLAFGLFAGSACLAIVLVKLKRRVFPSSTSSKEKQQELEELR